MFIPCPGPNLADLSSPGAGDIVLDVHGSLNGVPGSNGGHSSDPGSREFNMAPPAGLDSGTSDPLHGPPMTVPSLSRNSSPGPVYIQQGPAAAVFATDPAGAIQQC
jgi:hypothetical protein